MLRPSDLSFIAREERLRSLPLAFDPEALAEHLRSLRGDWAPAGLEARYVRYKPGTNCLVLHSPVDGVGDGVYVKTFAGPVPRSVADAADATPGEVVLLGSDTVACRYPRDLKLASLGRVWSGARAIDRGGAPRVLQYKPERRATLRVGGPAGAVLKVYAPAAYASSSAARLALASDRVRLQRRLSHCEDDAVALFEWLPGTPASEAVGTDAAPLAAGAAGRAVAGLHGTPVPPLARRDRAAWQTAARMAADAVASVLPDSAAAAADVLAALEQTPAWSSRSAFLHGDLAPGQLILGDDGRAGLIDLDEASTGDPEADLGSFIAHVRRSAIETTGDTRSTLPFEVSFVSAYQEAGGWVVPQALVWYAACSLLRLAPEPFRRRHPDWPAATAAILEEAAEVLRGR